MHLGITIVIYGLEEEGKVALVVGYLGKILVFILALLPTVRGKIVIVRFSIDWLSKGRN